MALNIPALSPYKGARGEDVASDFLQQHGCNILARNVRLARGEIDIIAQQVDMLCFIEVKTYQQYALALQAVDMGKQRRIISAASAWLAKHPENTSLQCRFDLIILTPDAKATSQHHIEWIADAFRPS